MQHVETTAPLTLGDMTRAMRTFPGPARRRWLVFGVLCAVWVVLFLVVGGGTFGALLLTVFVPVSALVTIAAPWTLPRRARRNLGIGLPTTWRFDRAGSSSSNARGRTLVPWAQVADLRLDQSGGALLATSDRGKLLLVLPAGLSAAQVSAIHAWWRAGGAAPAG